MEQKQDQVTRTALLVEDDRIIQRITRAQLAEIGYEVDTADDATTAINKLKERAYCLIVTDLRLPDKSGTEVIKAARLSDLNQGTPLIVSSAQLMKSDFETYLDLGADAVLIKPSSPQVLEQTIKDCHLRPYYQRKFFYQIKTCIQSFEENLSQPQTKEELERWLDHFRGLLTQSLSVLQEYQQWSEFEKLYLSK